MSKTITWMVLPIAALLFAACATVPRHREQQQALVSQANATLQMMVANDPTLLDLLDRSAGYVVFPSVGEVAVLAVGGIQGIGVVFEQGEPIGFARIREGTIGPQIGGQNYSQLIVLQDEAAMQRLKGGNFDLTAGLRATAIGWGVAADTQFEGGVASFISSEKGLIAGATIGGQQLTFEPMA